MDTLKPTYLIGVHCIKYIVASKLSDRYGFHLTFELYTNLQFGSIKSLAL